MVNVQEAEAFIRGCSVKKVFLEISQNPQENTFTKKETKNTFFYRTPPVAASVSSQGNEKKHLRYKI